MKRLETRSCDILNESLTNRKPISIPDQNMNISLETAIEPLIELLPNLQFYASIVKDKCANPGDGLTSDQSASIMLYSMHWEPAEQCLYYALNSALRSESRLELKPWFLYLTLLIKAVYHLPSISFPVYRRIQLDLSEKYPVGQTFIWRGFVLCSMLQLEENSDNTSPYTTFIIEGHSGKDIRKHCFFPDDDQIIFTAASQFQVLSSVHNDQGQYIIHLKEVQSTQSLLHFTNGLEILSVSHLLNSLPKNIPSTSSDEKIEKSIDRLLKLQLRIEKYSLYSIINLTNENLVDEDISFVIQHAIIKKRCSILRLDENFITSEGMNLLVNSLHHTTTCIGLNLYSNRLFDKGLHPLIKPLSNNSLVLQKLHLGANRISNEGALILAEMLKTNTTLTVLRLDNNRIGDDGVHFLSNALIHSNKTLQKLSLKRNKLITSLSIPDLLEIFQCNQSLIRFNIRKCSLTKEDNQRLKNISNTNERNLFQLDREEEEEESETCVLS